MTNVAEQNQGVNAAGEQLIADMDDDTLAETWHWLCLEAEKLGKVARGAHEELRRRMIKDGATVLNTPHWEGKLKAGTKHHTIDDAQRLMGRLAGRGEILPSAFEATFIQPPAPPMRVDQNALNKLHKRGGEIARIIDEERTTTEADLRLVLERKAEVV